MTRSGAHPRSRGEHSLHPVSLLVRGGSSPLARGTRTQRVVGDSGEGLIPARAGNTGSGALPANQSRAHPRSRGEHNPPYGNQPLGGAHPRSRGEHHQALYQRLHGEGSSPLARGTLNSGPVKDTPTGLIPARAGNTHQPAATGAQCGAHPRSRGEHRGVGRRCRWRRGSSPLARGTLRERQEARLSGGLIPARAGNTPRIRQVGKSERAHPRSRGEHGRLGVMNQKALGSSPLARGTHVHLIWSWLRAGLIPARAGNTVLRSSSPHRVGAHPRSRGEHAKKLASWKVGKGSSPLARGTRGYCVDYSERVGLIPARAGNTAGPSTAMSLGWAHPRSRGEHQPLVSPFTGAAGSSPLARGTRSMLRGS